MKTILILALAFVVVAGAYFYFQPQIRYYVFHQGMPGYCDPGPCPNKSQNQNLTYANSQYRFDVTLTDAWEGYYVREDKPANAMYLDAFYIEIPTTDPTWKSDGGAFYPLSIIVFDKKGWQEVKDSEGEKPVYLGENSQYVFAYGRPMYVPNDKQSVDFGIDTVISSFKTF